MSERCAENCKLVGEFCAVRDALGPIVAEAEVTSEAANVFYDAAKDEHAAASRQSEVAFMELDFHAEEDRDASDLGIGRTIEASQALGRKLDALAAGTEAWMDAVKADPGLLVANLRLAQSCITTLPHLCKKGPADDGNCGAPLSRRMEYKRYLAKTKQRPRMFDGEWPLQ